MSDRVQPEEAARALAEIGRRQDQVIRTAALPTWYWWALACLLVAFAAAAENLEGLAVWLGAAVFVVCVLAATGRAVLGAARSAQPHNRLLGSRGEAASMVFAGVIVGVTATAVFPLTASGVSYGATIGASLTAVVLVVGGPMYTRHRQSVMRANRSGSRR